MTADQTKEGQEDLETDLETYYYERARRQHRAEGSLEALYGIDLVLVALSDVDFEPAYQETRMQKRKTRAVNEMAASIVEASTPRGGQPTLSFEDAHKRAMVITKDVVMTERVVRTAGEGPEALAALLIQIFGNPGGGN